ncbi:PP2C family protein-serine/threonine phosphatase [Roseovarius sp. C7]|uniref:PP2C family protein-serine/threonine phosphatase n=1 Tax=Roseovarius sp. C7 TaxID=3398643 RepID=UPI0039F69422
MRAERDDTEGVTPGGAMAASSVIRDVLIVDDSRLQRRIAGQLLARWGYRVREAASGDEALMLCEAALPDLVLSDWMMPGMSGPEFCTAFRALAGAQYGYFILLTAKSDKGEVAAGLDAGADDFLTKPVNGAELRARISAGERILRMQREMAEKNRLVTETLDQLQRLYDEIDRDLMEARKLQQSLIAERHRDFGAAKVSLLLESAGHVGGDLVGMFRVNEGVIGLYALDVSGHGISSALMTARLAGYLSASVPEQNVALQRGQDGRLVMRPPGETLAALNQMCLEDMETEHYFTICLVEVDLGSGRLRLAQAGHPHPVLQRRSGTCELLGRGGLPVGLIPGAEYEEITAQLGPGDRLMVHSDGVVECADPKGVQLGDAGLQRILGDLNQTRGPACLESVLWKLADHAGGAAFEDDVSAVLLEFTGGRFVG